MPTLTTARLRLRPVGLSDAGAIQAAASDRAIADTMVSIPHPYPPGEAERYVAAVAAARDQGRGEAFAIEYATDGAFCGVIEIRDVDREHRQAELSFWLARRAWGQGIMSEAVRAAAGFGIDDLGLNRLYAHHMVRNPASGRVLGKAGFVREGILRQRVRKWGRYEDVALCALLADDWRSRAAPGGHPA